MNDDLVRLEYKLDLIIQALMAKQIMLPSLPSLKGIERDCCPICSHPIKISADFSSETVRYCCGCTAPNQVVSGISELLNSAEENNNVSKRTSDSGEVFEQEKDGSSDS